MTRFPDGGYYLYRLNQPMKRLLVLPALILAGLLLSACTGREAISSWAGISTDGRNVFVANGPTVLSYNVESGNVNWTYPSEPNARLLFFAAPSVADDQVVFGDYGQAGGFFSPRVTVSVYALEDSDSGVPPQLWTNSEAASDKIVAPPLQVGDQVFVGTADNHIMALSASTGALQWDFETEHAIWGQPSYKAGTLYVASMDWSVYALDAATGDLKWETPLGGALPSKPVLGEELLYVSSFDGNVHALNQETGSEEWQASGTTSIWGAPALSDGVLYFGDLQGNLFAVDAATGRQLWTRETGSVLQSSPLVVDNTLYVASQVNGADDVLTGALTAYSTADGEQVWQRSTSMPLYASPVVVGDDTIVVGMQGGDALLVGFDLTTGNELWRYTPPAS